MAKIFLTLICKKIEPSELIKGLVRHTLYSAPVPTTWAPVDNTIYLKALHSGELQSLYLIFLIELNFNNCLITEKSFKASSSGSTGVCFWSWNSKLLRMEQGKQERKERNDRYLLATCLPTYLLLLCIVREGKVRDNWQSWQMLELWESICPVQSSLQHCWSHNRNVKLQLKLYNCRAKAI